VERSGTSALRGAPQASKHCGEHEERAEDQGADAEGGKHGQQPELNGLVACADESRLMIAAAIGA